MIYVYLFVSPFYMFALVTTRDWPALWVIGLMLMLFLVQFFHSGFRFWLDSSHASLLFFVAAYIAGTLLIVLTDHSVTLLGRSPGDRAITTLTRVLYVMVVYGLFVNFLADADSATLRRIFVVQIMIGAVIALFGIVQYITAAVFSWGGLIGIEGTNETFKMGSTFFGFGKTRLYRSAAIFQEPSAFGFFLVPLFLKVILSYMQNVVIVNRPFHLALVGIYVLAILFNFSLTAIFASAILMAVLVGTTFRGSRVVVGILFFSLLCLGLILLTPVGCLLLGRLDRVFSFSDVSTLDRLFRVYVGIMVFLKAPLIGVGPGYYGFLYPIYGGLERMVLATPLNIWLTILTDVGIVGIIPFLFFLRNIFRRARTNLAHNPLVRVYIWSTASFLLLLTTIDLWYLEVFWFEAAMLVVLSNGNFSELRHSTERVALA